MTPTYDVGIVGAGIHGASAAFHLASMGASVAIVEKTTPAGGPTGVSSAVCRAYYTNRFLAECARNSIAMFENFEALVGADAGHRRTGIYFLHPPEDVEEARGSAQRLGELGIDIDLLDGDGLAAELPGFDLDGVALAAFERNAGYADPHAATNGIFAKAVELGVAPLLGRTVVTIESGPTMVLDDGEHIQCGRVLIAAGPWTKPLAAMVGADLPLTVERHIVASFRWAGVEPVPAYGDIAAGYYLRPEGEDLFIAGPLLPEPEVDPDHFQTQIRPEETESLAEKIMRRVPRLEGVAVQGGWASLYDVSPDWQPVIGEIAPDVFVDAGTSGHGFKLAPELGRHVAAMVLGDETDPGLLEFRPDRFATGHALSAGYGDARILG
jgi:glycine/D-amino acid oxidase-like deaminating enzyme